MPKTDNYTIELIAELKKKSRVEKNKIWSAVAEHLEKSRKNYHEVNVGKLNQYHKDEAILLVPGKILGTGKLEKPVTVSSLKISRSALAKIQKAGGKYYSLKELINTKVEVKNIILIG